MGKDIALPEVTQHAIMNYPLPDHQTGQKYSPFTYLHTDSARNLCGTVHNVASPEMLYCSSSSGEHFDRRARELRQSPSVVEGIILHANRPTESKQRIHKKSKHEKHTHSSHVRDAALRRRCRPVVRVLRHAPD